MKQDSKKTAIILFAVGTITVIWLALLIAPYESGGLAKILPGLTQSLNNPFNIKLCEDSQKTVLILLLVYGVVIGVYLST